MAVMRNGSSAGYTGMSTDDKPDNAEINELFLELDTGDFYYFDGASWAKVGGDS
jgi:hypothetical protein